MWKLLQMSGVQAGMGQTLDPIGPGILSFENIPQFGPKIGNIGNAGVERI